MLDQFKEYLTKHKLIEAKKPILLGVSGGVDSVVMTNLFNQLNSDIAIAHCNFQLRVEDANTDQEFVRNLAEKFNVPFHTINFDTEHYAEENGISIQMAARDLRFNWFNQLIESHNYQSIAIASNLNDSIESCLINLTKGTGLKGLHGIQPKSGNIIHPLLFATKTEIIDYANENGIQFREDKSNLETKYLRNNIRHNVIPKLKDINPSIEDTFHAFFNKISGYEQLVEGVLKRFVETAVTKDYAEITVDKEILLSQDSPSIVLYEFLTQYGFNGDQSEQVLESLTNQSGKKFSSNSHELITSSHSLHIREKTIQSDKNKLITKDDLFIKEPISLSILQETPRIIKESTIACLDYKKLQFPLTIRKWEAGDSFKPLGMQGKKKLSDFFTDIKLSIFEKENTFVITSNNKIVWVVGHRIDNDFKVTEKSTSQLTIKLE